MLVNMRLLERLVNQGRGLRGRVVKLGHQADLIIRRAVPLTLNALLLLAKAWQRRFIHRQVNLIASHALLAGRLQRLNILWLDAAPIVVDLRGAKRVLFPLLRHLADLSVQHCIDGSALVIRCDWGHGRRLL